MKTKALIPELLRKTGAYWREATGPSRIANQSQQTKRNPVTNMITSFNRIVALLCITALVAILGMGCNTARGFGKDMEKAGEKIQDGTK